MLNSSVIGFNLCKTEMNTNYVTLKLCANLQMKLRLKNFFSFMNEEINKNFLIISVFL